MPIRTKVGSDWKSVSNISTNVGGTWKVVPTIKTAVGTAWKEVWNYGNDSYTKLLLHFDGTDEATTTTDASSSAHAMTFAGDSKIDSAQSKFGGTSLCMAESAYTYISTPWTTDFNLGAEDFTIDFWFRPSRVSGTDQQIWSIGTPSSNDVVHMQLKSDGKLSWIATVGGVSKAFYTATHGMSNDTWYHIAVVRSGSSFKMYKDGVSLSLTETTAIGTNDIGQAAGLFYMGRNYNSYPATGWIDEFRLSKGIVRWTENFTPHDAPYD
jgi:hypothetical protein